MAEMRSERRQMEMGANFASKQAGVDSADGDSSMELGKRSLGLPGEYDCESDQGRLRFIKESQIKVGEQKQAMAKPRAKEAEAPKANAKAESGKRPEMQYEWMKRPEESEDDYQKRLSRMKEQVRKLESRRRQRGKKKSLTDAEKPQESVTVGSGKSALDQEVIGPNSTEDDEDMLQQMVQFKLDIFGDSFVKDEAEEKERRAMLKETQQELARRKKAMLLYWQGKESQKPQAPVTESAKSQDSAMDKETIADDDKESSKQALKDKLDILDSNRTTQVRAKPNSVTIQDDHVDKAKSALAKKTADEEAEAYYWYRKDWENNCCKVGCEHFLHKTTLSSMQFTHRTPEDVLSNAAEALQIFSMKLKLTYDNVGGFEFPLSVYGFVAVRDTLDSRRNILFSRCATEAQQVTHDDPFLHLTGPSRAILSLENVWFEIYLRVKGAAGSRDKPLITWGRSYGGGPLCFDNVFCRLEVCLQTIEEAVQATIVAVQIVRKEGLWPYNFAYGGLVACIPRPRKAAADSDGASSSNQEIVLVKSIDREMLQGSDGYLHLSRQVVCVQGGGGLDVVIQAYEKSGSLRAEGCVHFKAQNCHMSQQQCIVGRARVNVTVAWSIIPTDMDAFGFF